jgi:hypothetical protein
MIGDLQIHLYHFISNFGDHDTIDSIIGACHIVAAQPGRGEVLFFLLAGSDYDQDDGREKYQLSLACDFILSGTYEIVRSLQMCHSIRIGS